MKNMSKTILFFGNERLATGVSSDTLIFKQLLSLGYKIPALIVSQDNSSSSRSVRQVEIVDVAKSNSIEVLSYSSLKEAKVQIAQYGAEAAVLVAYGKIIPSSILDLFPLGIINIHPSILPKHRGPTPLESVILAGDNQTGVSIMRLGKGMDSGPIYAQEAIELTGNETKQNLAYKLDELGREMLTRCLPSILDETLKPVEQADDDATYDGLITKQDGTIDWKTPAIQIERQIRAFSIWPKSRTTLNNIDVTITEGHTTSGTGKIGSLYLDEGKLGVYTSDGILLIDRLIPSGKKEMPSNSFLAGYRYKL
jgi:methionyl-tRNA formyltransferase